MKQYNRKSPKLLSYTFWREVALDINIKRALKSYTCGVRLTKIYSALGSHAEIFNYHDHTFKVSDLNCLS